MQLAVAAGNPVGGGVGQVDAEQRRHEGHVGVAVYGRRPGEAPAVVDTTFFSWTDIYTFVYMSVLYIYNIYYIYILYIYYNYLYNIRLYI